MLPWFITAPDPAVYLGSANYLVADFETTNLEKGTALQPGNRLLLARWRFRGKEGRKWGSEFEQDELLSDLEKADFLIAHNAKFELQWLKRAGADLHNILVYDTMIGEKVLWANRPAELSLDATLARRGIPGKHQMVAAMIHNGVCPSLIPTKALDEYCGWDVESTERVFLQQREELRELGLLPVMYCRNLVTPVLADIEFNGMQLDPERVLPTWAEYAEKYNALEKRFSEETQGINFKSSLQVRQLLYGQDIKNEDGTVTRGLGFAEVTDHKGRTIRTKKNNPSVNKLVIAQLEATTPEQKKFKKLLGELAKLKTPMQNLNKMKLICEASPNDPRIFASFNQTVTDTDRLSSTGRGKGGFQFHNFDRAFKRLFRARRPGWGICEADAPQLEFRVAAELGDDPVAKKDIQTGLDVHGVTAATLGGSRQDAKPFTFKPLYGGNSGTPRQRKYYAYFRERYDRIYRAQRGWTLRVARDKFLVTPWGFRLYWPDAKLDGNYVTHTTEIFNYPIQSFATADIIPLVLVLVWHSLAKRSDVLLINTIHDSIVMEYAEKALDSLVDCIVSCFTNQIYPLLEEIYGIHFETPLGVGVKAGSHWSDGDERQFEPWGRVYKPGKWPSEDAAAASQLQADSWVLNRKPRIRGERVPLAA